MKELNKFILKLNQSVTLLYSTAIVNLNRFNLGVLDCLEKEGYLRGYVVLEGGRKAKVFLKYRNGRPVFDSLQLISKPSVRVYTKDFFRKYQGEGAFIVSSNGGIGVVKSADISSKKVLKGEVFIKIC